MLISNGTAWLLQNTLACSTNLSGLAYRGESSLCLLNKDSHLIPRGVLVTFAYVADQIIYGFLTIPSPGTGEAECISSYSVEWIF